MTEPTSQEPDDPGSAARRSQVKAYEGAFEAVAAVVIGALLGYWIDTQLDSSPWALVVGVALGFAAMVLRLLRLGTQLGMTAEDPNDGKSPKA